jgi:hypothetical protein
MVAGADPDFSATSVLVSGVYRILRPGSLYLLVILSNTLLFHLMERIGTKSEV